MCGETTLYIFLSILPAIHTLFSPSRLASEIIISDFGTFARRAAIRNTHKPSPFRKTNPEGGGFLRIKWKYAVAGGAAGLANGFFGGGGGSVFVPLLTGYCGLDQRRAFATSVAVILPLCALSAGVYLLRGGLDLMAALPYLIGGALGGWTGGKLFRGVKIRRLRRLFGLLLIYGGVRCFF